MSTSSAALDGINVVDVGRNISGPYAAKLLGLYGASVVKVEPSEGDPLAKVGPFLVGSDGNEHSLFYLYLNHAKEVRKLDWTAGEGREELLRVIGDADVLVENWKPGYLDDLGLGWDFLHALNPRLVVASISSFGQSGPYRDYEGGDLVVTSLGGLAYQHGHPDRVPLVHGNPQAEYRGGVVAAAAVVAALLNHDGEGEHIDISLMECVAGALREVVPDYTFMGAIRRRSDRARGGAGKVTPCRDGFVIPSGLGANFPDFARFMNAPELADERFATGEGREAHADEFATVLRKRLSEWDMSDYFVGAQTWGMNAGVVMSATQALECEQHEARGFFTVMTLPDGRQVSVPRGPFSL